MPQVGQGFSNIMTQLHAGIPSWVWVACPCGSGVKNAAVESTKRHASARIAAPMRSPVEERSGVVRSSVIGCAWFTAWRGSSGD